MEAEARYDVVWPLGRSRVEAVQVNERLEDLSGKTVAFLWDYLFKGPEMFEMIQEQLASIHPGIRFVDYSVFGNFHATAAAEQECLAALPDLLREHQVDAAVVAVGA
jgi:hypothetical protein